MYMYTYIHLYIHIYIYIHIHIQIYTYTRTCRHRLFKRPPKPLSAARASPARKRPSSRSSARPAGDNGKGGLPRFEVLRGMWGFPKIRGPFFGSPDNKSPTILGCILGAPIVGDSHIPESNHLGPSALGTCYKGI